MMQKSIDQIIGYLNYYSRAKSKYKIHPPFVFDLVVKVLESKELPDDYRKIENIRKELLKRKEKIVFQDLGAGSNKPIVNENQVKISSLTKNSSVSRKFALLLYHIVKHYKLKNILEGES